MASKEIFYQAFFSATNSTLVVFSGQTLNFNSILRFSRGMKEQTRFYVLLSLVVSSHNLHILKNILNFQTSTLYNIENWQLFIRLAKCI